MNKSLEQRVRNLEAAVHRLEQQPKTVVLPPPAQIEVTLPVVEASNAEAKETVAGRAMCPKCGVKPNHYFHVKWCGGEKQDGDKATDRQRDQS